MESKRIAENNRNIVYGIIQCKNARHQVSGYDKKKADLILLLHHFHRITVFVVVHCKLQYMQNSSALL